MVTTVQKFLDIQDLKKCSMEGKNITSKNSRWILHDRQNKSHKFEMSQQKFPSIDLIIVNFYPFQKVVTNNKISKDIIENIDIGGPTLVRAAAKNFKT